MAYRKTPAVKAHLKEQREKIIAAAAAVVAKGGRDRILARTVEKAGISMGTVYQHFADVDEMWAAVVASALARNVAAMQEAVETGPAYPANALARAIAAFYGSLDELRLARCLAEMPAYRRGIRAVLEPFLAELGTPPRAREQQAAAIFGALYGLADVEATPKSAVAICLQLVGVPAEGARGVAVA